MSAQKTKNKSDPRYVRKDRDLYSGLNRLLFRNKYVVGLRTKALCKEAKTVRSTVKNHCDSFEEILEKYDHEMWADFLKIRFDELTPTEGWQRVMLFMQRYKEAFVTKFKQTDDRFVREMVRRVIDKNGVNWTRFKKDLTNRFFEMFYGEALGVLTVWVKEGMKTVDIERWAEVLAELMRTAEKRWIEIVK